ncbi:MAG: RDD family protein [Planctomycetota bacterium]
MIDAPSRDRSLGSGVFFHEDAYPGLIRRILAWLIDGVTIVVMAIAIWIPLVILFWDPGTGRTPDGLFVVLWMVATWLYLTVAKRSWIRTVGYQVCGLQIVTTRGERPTIAAMTLRLMLWIFAPFNIIVDLIWMGVDTERQTLRDCYTRMYIVRKGAHPIGAGEMHLTRYFAAGLAPSYPRVVRPLLDSMAERVPTQSP